ncbi:hydroxymethylbilane synthase [Candidatus Pelagibacter sp. HIMB1321]|uniref:hydroxymethylbilane synthase n=1 Tax=Candidatus Pelagibacter sp. HIMB1321 TaxID=1388755 RepID=UPI000A081DA3|nr:hydroxymethylbilane synthase [Candidatus Pelagibacter sp. HIMB1321]SMF80966.1 hydroxymethylbilane synthase [Candidatus Pelagibacter sp. HIMB1321]
MKKEKIIIGSRGSKLALIYAQKVKNKILENSQFHEDEIIIKEIITKGDQVQDKRLSEVGGKGLFSKNIEKELLEDNIDIAVHALKDMPAIETKGLLSNFFLKRNDPREILISRNGVKLEELKDKSIIGTSSYRREFQINRLKENVSCKLIRGNVDTRLRKLKEGLYDAIILSLAGIKSLELETEITQIFLTNEIIPSAGQGIICAQCKENNFSIIDLLNKINDPDTYKCAIAERDILKILEGDCETAVGAHAVLKNNEIALEAELFSLDGKKRYFEKEKRSINEFDKIGLEIGKILKDKSNGDYKK